MRVFIMKKKTLIKAGLFALAFIAAVIYTVSAVTKDADVFSDNGLCLKTIEGEKNAVALTFDTAFGEDYTRDILKTLQEKGAKATFAVMGRWAEQNPELVKEIINSGNEIISHSMNHEYYNEIGADKAVKDALCARELLKLEFGIETDMIRPPYGQANDAVLQALHDEGFIPVGWSTDSEDWRGDSKDNVKDRVLSNAKGGSIIVMQNNCKNSADALSEIIDGLYDMNYECITLTKLEGDNA